MDAGYTAQQDPPAAVLLLQQGRPDLGSHASGHLAHRSQQRKASGGVLDRLVSHAGGSRLKQRLGDPQAGGQVQIGEQDLAMPHVVELRRNRFLDLQDHLGLRPHGLDVGQRCTGYDVGLVVDSGARPGPFLHQHLVAGRGQLTGSGGG